jgi:hypothetical protein
MALTIDACGGPNGSDVDNALIAALVRGIGEQVVGFTVNGDAGATLSPAVVHSALTTAIPGPS